MDRQKEHGFELIRSNRDNVELMTSSAWIDLVEFQRIVSRQNTADLVALCEIYRGDLLEGLGLEDSGFGGWLQLERTKLRDAFISAVSSLIESPAPDVDHVALRIAARQLIEVDPYNEPAHRTLMRLFAEERETARVRDIYFDLRQRLGDDLDIEPDPATAALYRSLLPARPAEPETRTAQPSAQPALQTADDDGSDADAPLVAMPNRAGVPKITILPPPPITGEDYRHQIAVSLVEDVTINICRHRTFSVVAPHTASQLSGGGKKTLFRTFGITYAVETQLQNRGGEFWLAVKVIHALSREILWTEHYAFDREPAAQHYRDLSARILTSIVDRVERAELTGYQGEQNASAYHLFLSGQRYLRTLDLPNVRRARRAFRAATSTCPDFVPGISGLARTLQLEWLLRAQGDEELLIEADRLAARSIDIDPDDARGYRELGVCRAYAGRFDESLDALAVGEQRNPQHADLLNDFADALVHACEPAIALQKIDQAIELNPLCPDQYWWAAAGANYQLERYSEAVSCMKRMRDQTPALRLLAASWGMLGDREQAGRCVRLTKESHPDFRIGSWLSIMPFRDPTIVKKYQEGLRAAGFE